MLFYRNISNFSRKKIRGKIAELFVYYIVVRPKISPFSFGDSPSNAGNTVQVACTVAEGDRPLRISWNFYGEGLSSDMGVSTMPVGDSMNVLFISSVAPSNRGNYTCVANNLAGHDSFTAQLLVNGIILCCDVNHCWKCFSLLLYITLTVPSLSPYIYTVPK